MRTSATMQATTALAGPVAPEMPPEHVVTVVGQRIVRYGLVIVVAWIGALKYAGYESTAIAPLIMHSPFMSWLYDIFSVRALGAVLGTAEILAAVFIALTPRLPRLSVVGGAFATLLFVGTLSFLFTTPGVWEPTAGGFPALSGQPGQFLIKDLVLLGASVWALGQSLSAVRSVPRRVS